MWFITASPGPSPCCPWGWYAVGIYQMASCLCRRHWRPTPGLSPGNSHGRRSLVGCSPWGRQESDTTERLHLHFSLSCIGEGNGNPLVFLPGESQGWGSLVGCRLWGRRVGHDWRDLAAAAVVCGQWPFILQCSSLPGRWIFCIQFLKLYSSFWKGVCVCVHKHTSGGVGGIQENSSWESQRIVRGRNIWWQHSENTGTQRKQRSMQPQVIMEGFWKPYLLLIGQDQGDDQLM